MKTTFARDFRLSAIFITGAIHLILFLVLFFIMILAPSPASHVFDQNTVPEIEFMSFEAGKAMPAPPVFPEELVRSATDDVSGGSEIPLVRAESVEEEYALDAMVKKLISTRDTRPALSPTVEPGGRSPLEDGEASSAATVELAGRRLIRKPPLLKDAVAEGVVVVEIIVDKNGNVTRATPGKRGSTTSNEELWRKARDNAYQAKFSTSADGVEEQSGRYTFVFSLE